MTKGIIIIKDRKNIIIRDDGVDVRIILFPYLLIENRNNKYKQK